MDPINIPPINVSINIAAPWIRHGIWFSHVFQPAKRSFKVIESTSSNLDSSNDVFSPGTPWNFVWISGGEDSYCSHGVELTGSILAEIKKENWWAHDPKEVERWPTHTCRNHVIVNSQDWMDLCETPWPFYPINVATCYFTGPSCIFLWGFQTIIALFHVHWVPSFPPSVLSPSLIDMAILSCEYFREQHCNLSW